MEEGLEGELRVEEKEVVVVVVVLAAAVAVQMLGEGKKVKLHAVAGGR